MILFRISLDNSLSFYNFLSLNCKMHSLAFDVSIFPILARSLFGCFWFVCFLGFLAFLKICNYIATTTINCCNTSIFAFLYIFIESLF